MWDKLSKNLNASFSTIKKHGGVTGLYTFFVILSNILLYFFQKDMQLIVTLLCIFIPIALAFSYIFIYHWGRYEFINLPKNRTIISKLSDGDLAKLLNGINYSENYIYFWGSYDCYLLKQYKGKEIKQLLTSDIIKTKFPPFSQIGIKFSWLTFTKDTKYELYQKHSTGDIKLEKHSTNNVMLDSNGSLAIKIVFEEEYQENETNAISDMC